MKQRARAARSQWWRCVAGNLSFVSDTSSITPHQLVVELHTLERVCVIPSVIICKLKNEGSSGATCLHKILFQIGKNFYGDFSDVATGLWRGLFEPYTMSQVVPAFQIRQNIHRRQPRIWTTFHVSGRRSR